jgi:hypothetical protein
MFETGREIGHIVLGGFSDAVATGVKECAELWDMKVRGELPDENADDEEEEEEEKEKEYDDSEENTHDFFEYQKINGNARSLFI